MSFYCQNLGGRNVEWPTTRAERLFFNANFIGGCMPENRPYNNNGWEGKIDSIHKDIRLILEHVARQTFINEHHENAIDKIQKELDSLELKVSGLENKSATQDGALGF